MRRSPAPHHAPRIRSEIHVNVCTTLPENYAEFSFSSAFRPQNPQMPVKGGGGNLGVYFEYRHMQRDTRDPTLRLTLAQWNPPDGCRQRAPHTLSRGGCTA